ncbi:fatty acid synthase alpha subunit Lsd1 [Kickxella alabastrina]|uniref:Fatty acid synthase alpha subunit Lsd1 n=1 Tax=Kickxella alabastrina TaxID=61397 RepID=A0ACC1IVR5_9FUNG|nr:fatty acid synthase alpha subunit Lsd1 [Kickxella alabastrina]
MNDSLEGPKYALGYLAQQQASELLNKPLSPSKDSIGVGVDIELIQDININNPTFIERNFTTAEQTYCWSRPNAHASFAGKWCAKEAVIKAVSSLHPDWEKVWVRGSAAPLVDVEISMGVSGAPKAVLNGEVAEAAEKAGVSEIKVSISHIDAFAIATAIAK